MLAVHHVSIALNGYQIQLFVTFICRIHRCIAVKFLPNSNVISLLLTLLYDFHYYGSTQKDDFPNCKLLSALCIDL